MQIALLLFTITLTIFPPMPPNARTIAIYSRNAARFCDAYERFDVEERSPKWKRLVPAEPATVLDVGSGSGRDAAWFASRGHRVVAAEPAEGMLAEARRRHPDAAVEWLHDGMPLLEKVCATGLSFEFIQLSAVWMHVPPRNRPRAFRTLAGLLAPRGLLLISLRHGPFSDNRVGYPVSCDEVSRLARRNGLSMKVHFPGKDRFGREGVTWESVGVGRGVNGE